MTDVPLGRLGPITGRTSDVSVTLTDLSFRQTRNGIRYPYADFGSDFIETLHRELVAPRRRGLLRSTLVCPRCDTTLDGVANERVAVTAEVALKRIPPIHVDLEMPGIRCPGCDRPVVRIDDRSVDSELSDALIAAFKSIGLEPG
jgi:hypothetical protein